MKYREMKSLRQISEERKEKIRKESEIVQQIFDKLLEMVGKMSDKKNNSQLELVIEHLETEYENWRRTLSEHRTWVEMYGNSDSGVKEVVKETLQNLMDDSDYRYGCLKAAEILRNHLEESHG